MISSIAKLVRYPNLLMVGLTMILFWWKGQELLDLDLNNLTILILAVMATTAAGYLISDMYDVTADKINKPRKALIENQISSTVARRFYRGLLIFVLICTILLFTESKDLIVPLIIILTNGLLFLYARFLKRQKVIGNLLVAFLSAIVVLMPPLSGIGVATEGLSESQQWLWVLSLGFALWAFVVSLAREITKDLEDQEGDRAAGYKTLPLHSDATARQTVTVLLVAQAVLVVISLFCCSDKLMTWGFGYGLMLCIVALLLSLRIWQARDKIAYRLVSSWLKVYMAAGILFVLFWHI